MSADGRSPFDTQVTGYRVRRGKTVIGEYACPACPRRAFCMCAESATGAACRVIREQGGQVTIERLPDGALLSRHDVPPKGKSVEDWKGFIAADVDEMDESGVDELRFDEEPPRATDAGPGIEDGNNGAHGADEESA